MTFYNTPETAEEYIDMSADFDGRELIDELRKFLPAGSSVLELGMGAGKDLEILSEIYSVTGSDLSDYYLKRYRDKNPDCEILKLDAVTIETDQKFDAIYSNKVLMHLTEDELISSLKRQKQILNPGGLVLHSFWTGQGVEYHRGLRFVNQTEDSINKIFAEFFTMVKVVVYDENRGSDSLYILASC